MPILVNRSTVFLLFCLTSFSHRSACSLVISIFLSFLFYIANVGIFLRAIQFYSLFFAFIAVVYNLVLGFCNYSDIRNPLYDCTQLHNDSTKVQSFVENIAAGTKKAGTLRLYADDTGQTQKGFCLCYSKWVAIQSQ